MMIDALLVEWQTRRFQKPVPAQEYRFKSGRGHAEVS